MCVFAEKSESVPLSRMNPQADAGVQFRRSEVLLDTGSASDKGLSLLASVNRGVEPLKIEFFNLGLVLKKSKKTVLEGVSGVLLPGTMTAVLGPSGSGKTTFLTALASRANYGILSSEAEILINGRKSKLSDVKSILGFVPQEDVMIRNLTVRQVLTFAALSHLPSTLSRQVGVVSWGFQLFSRSFFFRTNFRLWMG
jgi:ABC-type multidrug transport system fused ATPase/permease subunit